ncbi:MAG: DegT/DnrJ/EryC1/StrS family aminotransferase, partial [Candidatus Eremiobacteraeota bacterium]|nr:DegT/DnrJ/EryC1/StrS family aminotransferase [Candidatus Eremiobacteraeota bacterium]
IGAIGDAGAVLTRSTRIAGRVRALANHGRSAHYEHAGAGWNSRMDTIQAAWLLRALAKSKKVVEERRQLVRKYATHLHFPGDRYVVPPMTADDNGYVQLNMVERPELVQKRLMAFGVDSRRIYPLTIADQPCAKGLVIPIGELPFSRRAAAHALCLPLFYGMRNEDVERCAAMFMEATR